MTTTTATASKRKPQKLDDLIRSADLWVVNATANNASAMARRVIAVNYDLGGGRVKAFTIPDTPHPVYLSNLIAESYLLASNDLREYIARGILTLVTPEEAEAYYEENEHAHEALRRAYSKISNTNLPLPKTSLAATDISGKTTEEQQDANRKAIGMDTQSDPVTAVVRGIINSVNTGAIKPEEGILDLQNVKLTEDDLHFVISKDTMGPLREYAKTLLAKKRSTKTK